MAAHRQRLRRKIKGATQGLSLYPGTERSRTRDAANPPPGGMPNTHLDPARNLAVQAVLSLDIAISSEGCGKGPVS